MLHSLPDDLILLNESISQVDSSSKTLSSGTSEISAPESQVMGSLCAPTEPNNSLSLKGITFSEGIRILFT